MQNQWSYGSAPSICIHGMDKENSLSSKYKTHPNKHVIGAK
jgi:hypothetical protein